MQGLWLKVFAGFTKRTFNFHLKVARVKENNFIFKMCLHLIRKYI